MINIRRRHGGLFDRSAQYLISRARRRPCDFIIGGEREPYMLRWWLTPWSGWYRDIKEEDLTWWQWLITRLPGAYLHRILRSDDDRALHDHPWCNISILLEGQYVEHVILPGGIHERTYRQAGCVTARWAKTAHRLEIIAPVIGYRNNIALHGPHVRAWSLFLFGFRLRHWGFHCPERGWVHWREFTNPADGGATVGKGCGP